MKELEKGQTFVNGKPLEIADQIDWKAFNETMDDNVLQAALECARREEFEHRLRFIHNYKIQGVNYDN